MSRARRPIRLLVLAALFIGLSLWGQAWVPSLLLLADLSGAVSLPPVAAQAVLYRPGADLRHADLYPAVGRERATGIVVMPGAAMGGKDDPKLVAFAQALARAGFTVLVPDSPSARALRLGPENLTEVTEAATWLRPHVTRVGVMGISYGTGPALLAAHDHPELIDFVIGLGGYQDLTAVITFFITGAYAEAGQWQTLPVNPYGRWLFLRSNAQRLRDAGDRTRLEELAQRRVRDPQADIQDLLPPLTPPARAVAALVTSTDPTAIPAQIAALPEAVRADLDALSLPEPLLRRIAQPVLLIHGRDDLIVPVGESRKLAAFLPHATLIEIPTMAHTEWDWHQLASLLPMARAVKTLMAWRS